MASEPTGTRRLAGRRPPPSRRPMTPPHRAARTAAPPRRPQAAPVAPGPGSADRPTGHPARPPRAARASTRCCQSKQLEQALFEIKKVIVGQDRAIERLFVCLLAGGHGLLEGVPGLAKTLAVETLASVVGGTFARLQFTPDLLPADIVGTRIYRASTEQFDIELGPVFANFVLADEINRAPAKVQSALLEVMAEHHVSIGGKTFDVPLPFLVLATQNPIESEGVYPLPEAQRDRFLMKIVDRLPDARRGARDRAPHGRRPAAAPTRCCRSRTCVKLQAAADQVYVDHGVVDYAVSLVLATREPEPLQPARARRAARASAPAPGQPRPRRRRPRPRPAAGPQLRPAPGRVRHRPRRPAPPARAVLRGAGPGPGRSTRSSPASSRPSRAPRIAPSQDPEPRDPGRSTAAHPGRRQTAAGGWAPAR